MFLVIMFHSFVSDIIIVHSSLHLLSSDKPIKLVFNLI